MNADTLSKHYDEFTFSTSNKYFKVDSFLKNPAPPNVPLNEVMKKVQFLINFIIINNYTILYKGWRSCHSSEYESNRLS